MNVFFSLLLSLTAAGRVQLPVARDDTFEKTVQTNMFNVVFFTNVGCDECETLLPLIEEAYDVVKKKGLNVHFHQVNGQDSPEIVTFLNVHDYPIVAMFDHGDPSEFTDRPFVASEFVEWIEHFVRDPIKGVETVDEIDLEEPDKGIFLLRPNNDDDISSYREMAYWLREEIVFYMLPKSTEPTLMHVVQLDKAIVEMPFKAKMTREEVSSMQIPVFGEITQKNFPVYMTGGRHIIWFVGSQEDYKTSKELFSSMFELEREFTFGWLDPSKWTELAEHFLLVDSYPSYVRTLDLHPEITPGRYIFSPNRGISVMDWIEGMKKDLSVVPVKYINETDIEQDITPCERVNNATMNSVVSKYEEVLVVITDDSEHALVFEEQVLRRIGREYPGVKVVVIRGNQNEITDKRFPLKNIPSIYFKQNEDTFDYLGPRSYPDLNLFVKNLAFPSLKLLTDDSEVQTKDEL